MSRDFTLTALESLLISCQAAGYNFAKFSEYFDIQKTAKTVFLRHDIDARPGNALLVAGLEAKLGITGTYYFRTIKNVFVPEIISEIASMGHEIGYHYENMDHADGDRTRAILDFKQNLSRMRQVSEVHTICMHGSPLSKWNNIDLWEEYSYKDYGIQLEAFRDVDYEGSVYLTDTGRSWSNNVANMRDRVATGIPFNVRTTNDIIMKMMDMPRSVFITIHPQRWDNHYLPWIMELLSQRVKNVIKAGLRLYRGI